MKSSDWQDFTVDDFEALQKAREQYHRAVQGVSLIGRRYTTGDNEEMASLSWVPGLFRLAGKWIKGDKTFRASICFKEFKILLVDEKVGTIGAFDLNGKTYLQLMLWLEEQIGVLGLPPTNLQLILPYEMPYPSYNGTSCEVSEEHAFELGKYFHNSYISIRDVKLRKELSDPILTWPKRFDQAFSMVVKDSGNPETSMHINYGMSPGTSYLTRPFFYVSTWPHVDIDECQKLEMGSWVAEQWTGAVLQADQVVKADRQKETLDSFYRETSEQLIKLLTR